MNILRVLGAFPKLCQPRHGVWNSMCLGGNGEMMGSGMMITLWYMNIDTENHIVQTDLPTPIWQGLCEFTGEQYISVDIINHPPISY